MTILEFVTTFIANVKKQAEEKGKEHKGCHTVYSTLDGYNLNSALREFFGKDLEGKTVTVNRKDKDTGKLVPTEVSAYEQFPISAIQVLVKSGQILGHYAKGGFMVYLLGDAMVGKVADKTALMARFGMTPPPVLPPKVTAKKAPKIAEHTA